MDKTPEQSKGPQKQSSWQKNWNRLSRTLRGSSPIEQGSSTNDTHTQNPKEHRDIRVSKEENALMPTVNYLKNYEDKVRIIGFRGWTREEYKKQLDLALGLADHSKDHSLDDYSRFNLRSTGSKYERHTLRFHDKKASMFRDMSENQYTDASEHLQALQEELVEHLKDINTFSQAGTFNALPVLERYNQVAQFSDAVNRDMKEAVLKGLEGQTDPAAVRQRKRIRTSTFLSERYQALARKAMEQWVNSGTEDSPLNVNDPPPNVEQSLRLLRNNTIDQYRTLHKLSNGGSLESPGSMSEGSQSKSLTERLSEASDEGQERRIIFKYYEEKMKDLVSFRSDNVELSRELGKTDETKKALKGVRDNAKDATLAVEDTLITGNRQEIVTAFENLDRAIQNMSHMHGQIRRVAEIDEQTITTWRWIEDRRHMRHVRSASEQPDGQSNGLQSHLGSDSQQSKDLPTKQDFEAKRDAMNGARADFFSDEVLTDSTRREEALTRYETTSNEISQMQQKLKEYIDSQFSSTSTYIEEDLNLPPEITRTLEIMGQIYRHIRERSENNE